ncbi:MAG: 23S rRNA (pseudouridine(1915)-N(3))-methyltransferase RlmH [Pseudomonadales bacterium]|nr:23S rRNA (pseudouridine(1915)-N(3))-methyltransferase RlmH [Pseudomonadales bacterium]
MRVRIIAVGTRCPEWVETAFADFARRLPPAVRPELIEIPAASRSQSERAPALEAQRLLAVVADEDFVVALDECGKTFTSVALSKWLDGRRHARRNLAFLIGGPDGFAAAVKQRADLSWSLSALTLPHALVRVVLIEQLYRAHCLLINHPYHRA